MKRGDLVRYRDEDLREFYDGTFVVLEVFTNEWGFEVCRLLGPDGTSDFTKTAESMEVV